MTKAFRKAPSRKMSDTIFLAAKEAKRWKKRIMVSWKKHDQIGGH